MVSFAQQAQSRPRRSVGLVRPREGHLPRCHVLVDDDWGLYALSEGHGRGPAAEAVAAATLRACMRARAGSVGRAGEAVCQALFAAVAAELHVLCATQRAYGHMASSLAVALLGPERATIGIVGDCVAFIGRRGSLEPGVCGQSLLLGPSPRVPASVASFAREDGVRVLLAIGAVIELAVAEAELASVASPAALMDASREHAPHRDAGLVCIDLGL